MDTEYSYAPIFDLGEDLSTYRKLTDEFVSTATIRGTNVLIIEPEGLSFLAREACTDVSHKLRPSHLKQLAAILKDKRASANDKYVAKEMLRNAQISAEGVFPLCQDTGTAIIFGKKGQQVFTLGADEEALAKGVHQAYTSGNLRYSQNAPVSTFDEINTGNNLPAQIELHSMHGSEYKFLFIAKGGGSANKTSLFQETKAILNPSSLLELMVDKMYKLGTAACPPYHLAFVIGGTSAESNLKAVKLATAGWLDGLPSKGNNRGQAFRDRDLEHKLLIASSMIGMGAQFGGKYFCLDTRVIRLPRHGASCPIGIGVSCSADRNVKALINEEGIFLEKLESNPGRFLPEDENFDLEEAVSIDLDMPMDEIRMILSRRKVGDRVMLNGDIIVARDIAHARLKERMDKGDGLPDYFKNHIVYYAGPAKAPEGFACGSCGPTTSGRMDPYVPLFQRHGASLVMLGKGNRSKTVTDSCKRYGGFYLGSIGGPGALFGKECITEMEVLEYAELGMEAVYRIKVRDFPAFVIVDDKGHDFFANLAGHYHVLKSSRFLDTL